MENEPKEITLKISRIYFLNNYILAGMVITFLILSYFVFDWRFTLFPKTTSDLISTLTVLGIFGIGAVMIEQPEWERYRTRFMITMNEVIKEHGILSKEKVILPYATVADIKVERGVIGRILNYGTLSVSSFKAGSDMIMKGIRYPERMHVLIQNRVNLIREGQLSMFEKKDNKENNE